MTISDETLTVIKNWQGLQDWQKGYAINLVLIELDRVKRTHSIGVRAALMVASEMLQRIAKDAP